MIPIVEVPQTIAEQMNNYRDIFCREEGFDHVSRYVTGLIISQNKTLQGIYDLLTFRRATEEQKRATVGESKCERFEFSKGKATIGQRCRKIAREVLRSMLELSKRLFMEGKSTDAVLDMLMPA